MTAGLFWEAGQVNRCWETLPSPAGSPCSQSDAPTPHPSSRPSQQGHTVRPPSVLVSLDADRAQGGVWRILTKSQESQHSPRPLPCAQRCPACPSPPGGQLHQFPTWSWVHGGENASFRNLYKLSPKPSHQTLGRCYLSRPQCSLLENGREFELEICQGPVHLWLCESPKGQEREGQAGSYREQGCRDSPSLARHQASQGWG